MKNTDPVELIRRLLRRRSERPRSCRPAEQRDELASSEVEHGLLPGTRCASLPQVQDAPEAPVGPWGRPECLCGKAKRALVRPRLEVFDLIALDRLPAWLLTRVSALNHMLLTMF